MKFIAVLIALLGLFAVLPFSNAEDFDCNERCIENLITCGYDARRDCYMPFFSECSLKEAICDDGWNYIQRGFLECAASFDFCPEFYD